MKFTEEQLTKAFSYLIRLRDSGAVNMWVAPGLMVKETEFSQDQSDALFFLWRDVLTQRDMPISEQVAAALKLQLEKESSK